MSHKKTPRRRKCARPPLQQHDAFFRNIMTQPSVIRELLHARLPAKFLHEFPLASIEVMPTAFVDTQLNSSQADIVLRLTSTAYESAYVLVLVEHQTKPDRHLPFRLWGYMVDIVRQHLREAKTDFSSQSNRYDGDTQDKPPLASSKSILGKRDYPPVIPLVYYTGRQSPYPYSMAIRDLFPDSVATELMFASPYPLIEVALLPDDEILTHKHLAFYEFVVKCLVNNGIDDLLKGLQLLLVDADNMMDIKQLAWQYIAYNADENQHDFFMKLDEQFSKPQGETMASYAESLIRQGYEKGAQTSSRQIASQMLKLNFAIDIIMQVTGLSEAEVLAVQNES